MLLEPPCPVCLEHDWDVHEEAGGTVSTCLTCEYETVSLWKDLSE